MNTPTTSDLGARAEKKMTALENWLAPIFAKAPHLPENGRQTLVSIAPWLALIAGILGIISLFSLGAFSSFLSFSMWLSGSSQTAFMIAVVVGFIAAILDLLAFRPLSARRKRGWNLLFYGTVLTTVANLLHLFFGYGSIGSIIGAIIGFWLLFEVRGHYKA